MDEPNPSANDSPSIEPLLTVSDLAQILKRSDRSIRYWRAKGLPAARARLGNRQHGPLAAADGRGLARRRLQRRPLTATAQISHTSCAFPRRR